MATTPNSYNPTGKQPSQAQSNAPIINVSNTAKQAVANIGNLNQDLGLAVQTLTKLTGEAKQFSNTLHSWQLGSVINDLEGLGDAVKNMSATTKGEIERLLGKSGQDINAWLANDVAALRTALTSQLALNGKLEEMGVLTGAQTIEYDKQIAALDTTIKETSGFTKVLLMAAKGERELQKATSDSVKNSKNLFSGLWNVMSQKKALAFGGKVESMTGGLIPKELVSAIPMIAKGAMAFGIIVAVLERVLKSVGALNEKGLSLYRATGMVGGSFAALQNQMAGAEVRALTLGIETKDFYKMLGDATSSYMGLLGGASKVAEEKLSQMGKATIDLAVSAKVFGVDTATYMKAAIDSGRDFGVQLNKLDETYMRTASAFIGKGVQFNEMNTIMGIMGDAFRYTNITLDQTSSEAMMFADAITKTADSMDNSRGQADKFRASLPRLMSAGIDAFSKMEPSKYLAFLNKPVTNIGTEWMKATEASFADRMISFDDAMNRTVTAGYSGEEALGRKAIALNEIMGLPTQVSAAMARVLQDLSADDKAKMKGRSEKDQMGILIDAAQGNNKEVLKTYAENAMRLEDPMKTLVTLVSGLLDVVVNMFVSLPGIFGDGAARQRIANSMAKDKSAKAAGSAVSQEQIAGLRN